MSDIIGIIGAGGFGREVAHYISDINREEKKNYEIVFIDDNLKKESFVDGIQVLGSIEELGYMGLNLQVVCAVGNPVVKEKLVKRALAKKLTFTNIIHPSSYISSAVEMGTGIIICPDVIITTNVKIGNHVCINPQCGIGHDVLIKDYCSLYWNVAISGNVVLNEGCELGTKSTVIQEKTIGKKSIIGAGAVVTKDIPENVTAVGVPARVI